MFLSISRGRLGRSLLLAGVIAGASLAVTSAQAGECPADQKKPDATKPVDYETSRRHRHRDRHDRRGPAAGTSKTASSACASYGRAWGVVPWHSHGERPAIIYIIEGEIDEYASNCAVPIVHKAGDVVAETKDVSHWWKNIGDKKVVLLSADLLKDPNDHNM